MSEGVRQARRPAIPTLLYALACTLITERAVLVEGRPWVGVSGKVAIGIAAMLLVLCIFVHQVRTVGSLIAASLAVDLVVASLCLLRQESVAVALGSTHVSDWTFEVEEDSKETSRGYRCRAQARCEGMPSGSVWLVSDEAYDFGTCLRCTGRFQRLSDNEWGQTSRVQGICGTVNAKRITEACSVQGLRGMVCWVRRALLEAIDPCRDDARALVAGCLCGWRLELRAKGLQDLFGRCGASHLVAVSGGHLAIMAGMLDATMRKARFRPLARALVTAIASGLFVFMCGMPASALRAWVMATASLAGGLLGRRTHSLSGVCAAGLVMALAEPALSGSMSFLLSIASVIGLCVYGAYADYAIRALVPQRMIPRFVPNRAKRTLRAISTGLRQSIATSVVAQVVTLPFVASAFGETSLAGPVANAIVAVPFSAMQACGAAAGAFMWMPPVRDAFFFGANGCACVTLGVLRAVDAMPLPVLRTADAKIPWACVVFLVSLLVVWPKVSQKWIRVIVVSAFCAMTIVAARWRLFAPARITVLDVGQGDAILVQDGASAVLVDAGPDDAVLDALARAHVVHLDAVIVTHLHDDHYGGVASLAGRVDCGHVIVAKGVREHMGTEAGDAIHGLVDDDVMEVGYGDVIHVGSFCMRVVSPVTEVDGDENAESLVLLATYAQGERGLTALLTGDAEQDVLDQVLRRGDLYDIDVLKVGHHGSEVSITREQACKIDPEVSVASAGIDNKYGHPREECVMALREAGSEFWCTKDVGDVEVRPGKEDVEVRLQR